MINEDGTFSDFVESEEEYRPDSKRRKKKPVAPTTRTESDSEEDFRPDTKRRKKKPVTATTRKESDSEDDKLAPKFRCTTCGKKFKLNAMLT